MTQTHDNDGICCTSIASRVKNYHYRKQSTAITSPQKKTMHGRWKVSESGTAQVEVSRMRRRRVNRGPLPRKFLYFFLCENNDTID